MISLGVGVVVLAGGIGGWFFAVLFFVASLLPLDSLVRPETAVLALADGVLSWFVIKQGSKIEAGSLPVRDIRKVTSIKTMGRRTLSVQIELQTLNGQNAYLPMSLQLSVNEMKIRSALKDANGSIEIEERKE